MTDFFQSLIRGVDAAEHAEFAHNEIRSVLESVASAINRGFGLEFSVVSLPKQMNALEALATSTIFTKPEKETWLALRNPNFAQTDWTPLARWEVSAEGFPCRIVYDRTDVQCHDRGSLEDALSEMLSSASTGGTILRMTRP